MQDSPANPYPFNPNAPEATVDAPAPATSTTTTSSTSATSTSPGDVDPRDQEIAQLRQVIDELEAAQGATDDTPAGTSSSDTTSTSSPTDTTSTDSAASANPSKVVEAGHVVAQNIDHATNGNVARYGLVVAVNDPVVTGSDNDGNDTTSVQADVVWFGVDGRTTVPVDELDPIV